MEEPVQMRETTVSGKHSPMEDFSNTATDSFHTKLGTFFCINICKFKTIFCDKTFSTKNHD